MEGTEQAMHAIEYLQLDPLQIIARSQDITLHSRVLAYTPGMWEHLAYQQRTCFDWGGWLAVRPMDELPHWRVVMRRERERNAHAQDCPRPRRCHRRDAGDLARARHHEQSRL